MRNVPTEEAQEIRALLEHNEIEFFETFAGNWGISLPALWLKREEQFELARQILDDYQCQRSARVREQYQLQQERGEVRTLWHSFIDNPIRFITYLGLAGLVLFFSLQFFLSG